MRFDGNCGAKQSVQRTRQRPVDSGIGDLRTKYTILKMSIVYQTTWGRTSVKMRRIALTVASLWLVTGSIAHAALENATDCPAGAWTDWSTGTGVSISWSFTGISPVVSFQPNRIVFAPLTPAQVQKYEPTLDNLRAAATARKKVTIYWDNVNHTVSTIIVRWDQSC